MRSTLFFLLIAAAPLAARAEPYFVVTDLTEAKRVQLRLDDVREIFLGNRLFMGEGRRVSGVLSRSSAASADTFLVEAIGMQPDQYSAYWRRKLFAGKGHPPHETATDDEAMQYLQAHPGTVAVVGARPARAPEGTEVMQVNRAANQLRPLDH
jgi:hypothetical protein